MKAPAFQFYADDFIGGTVDFTAQEVGCYVRLLCYQWGNGSVPESHQKLKRICGSRVSDSVLSKFPNGVNPRLQQERLKQESYREKQAASGRASAQARFNHRSTTVQPTHQPNVNSPSPSPSPVSILPEEHTVAKARPDEHEFALEVPIQKTKKQLLCEDAVTLLETLNENAGTRFEPCKVNIDMIVARISEPGVKVREVEKMIERQCAEWRSDKMSKYLRPKTLFGAENFASYYGQRDLPITAAPSPTCL